MKSGFVFPIRHFSEGTFRLPTLVPHAQPKVLRGDRKVRIATALVTWTPTVFDQFQQATGALWRVCAEDDGITGGAGNLWYVFHVCLMR